jgi:hypothetical protein
MKNHCWHQARLVGARLLLAPASIITPPTAHADGERDTRSEAVPVKTGVRVTLLGILLMHVILVGAILACAAIDQS